MVALLLRTVAFGRLGTGRSLTTCKGKSPNKEVVKYTKANLPSKVCAVCGRPFSWRKAWAKVWDDVKYCSERCRRRKNSGGKPDELSE